MIIIPIILIAIALSLDAFTISLSIGTLVTSKKQRMIISLTVGIFHFLMPSFAAIIGNNYITKLELNMNFILGLVLLLLAINICNDILNKKESNFNNTFFGSIVFAISVSLDSFTTGLGIKAITDNLIQTFIMFSLFSASFTYLGLQLGKYFKDKLGIYASIIGIIILLVLGIVYICK